MLKMRENPREHKHRDIPGLFFSLFSYFTFLKILEKITHSKLEYLLVKVPTNSIEKLFYTFSILNHVRISNLLNFNRIHNSVETNV